MQSDNGRAESFMCIKCLIFQLLNRNPKIVIFHYTLDIATYRVYLL